MRAVIKDADVLKLCGTELESSPGSNARYVLRDVIGEGGHGVVFRAQRETTGETTLVVVKVLRPRAVRELAGLASVSLAKEVAALRRLAEGGTTAHVVRFFDAGVLQLSDPALELPWFAMEHVNGGVEGVTLRARVEASVRTSGFAFTAARALRLARHVCTGVAAIHGLGMLHRDLAPGNVLCTGTGDNELFKIADFGLARVSSVATFGNVLLGTPGYCAPEQSFPEKVGVGPCSDVFAVACMVFFSLAAEPYFVATSVPETLVEVYAPERRGLLDSITLHPELRARPETCAGIDRILAQATRADSRERPQTVNELAARLIQILAT